VREPHPHQEEKHDSALETTSPLNALLKSTPFFASKAGIYGSSKFIDKDLKRKSELLQLSNNYIRATV